MYIMLRTLVAFMSQRFVKLLPAQQYRTQAHHKRDTETRGQP